MRFCLSCGIAIAPDRLPDGFSPITIRDTQGPPPQKPIGKLLDAHYDGASFPAAPAAGAITAARAEPQNRQRVLLRYKRRVSRCCTFQRQGGQSGADRGGGASPPLCGGPSRSADAGTWDPHGRGGISSQAVHGEDSKRAAGLVGLESPRAAEIGCDQVEGLAVRAD